jgi:LCP family protein required for cell wall assembly
MMMRSRLEERRVRRKVRWTRVFLVLIVLIVLVTAMAGVAMYAYVNLFDANPVATGAAPVPKAADDSINKRINILLLGIDDGDEEYSEAPKRSDTMMVISVDPDNKTMSLLSIPRDTRVVIPGHKGYDKITHAYAYGGPTLSVQTVQDFLNIPIQYYVVADWKGFIKMVDILGGVDLYVERDMKYDDPYANLSIDLTKGYQHLDGEKAGEYVRYRHDELGDIGRVQRQQRFLKALNDEMFQVGTIFKLPSLMSTLNQYLSTNMSTMTMLKLANTLKGFHQGDIHSEMVPGDFATIDGLSYWVPNTDQTKKLVDSMFSSTGSSKVSGNVPGQNRSN